MKKKSYGPVTLAGLADKHLDDYKMDALIRMLQARLVWRRFVRFGSKIVHAAEWAHFPMDAEKAEAVIRKEALRRTR